MYKIIIGLLVSFLVYGIYGQVNKKSAKASRLSCQKNVVFFERVLDNDMIKIAQNVFKDGDYTISIEADKAEFMKSKLFEYVDIDEVKDYFVSSSKTTPKKAKNLTKDSIKISLLVYENDKLDPGKKTKKSKLYAGYIILGIKKGNHSIYRSQVDFMDFQGKDIHKRVDCLIASFTSAKRSSTK
jgi:hypothetical protein